jgi:Tol biopolymer transport system component
MGAGEEDKKKNFNVWLMRADGTDRQQVTSNESYDDSPVFLKNGRTLIFRSNRGGLWNLYKTNPKI